MRKNGLHQPHALVIPVTAEGHWAPLKSFIRQLVDQGVAFTLLATEKRVKEMQGYKDDGEFDDVDTIQLIQAFDDTKLLKAASLPATVKEMREGFYGQPSILQDLTAKISEGTGPTFVISDMFLSWTQDVADKLGIPRYAFFPSPCAYALICLQGTAAIEHGWYVGNSDEHKLEEHLDLPGLQNYRAKDMPSTMVPSLETYQANAEKIPRGAGILINSFEEMHVDEAQGLRSLLSTLAIGKVPSVFFIGPLLLLPSFSKVGSEVDEGEPKERSKCLEFLDAQQEMAVLYICFGSQWDPSPTGMRELARGLDISGVPFLWILRKPASWKVSDVLPEGFESRTEGRGLVWTDWAPQKEILAHPSTGGFLSHCGWNSTLEAVCSGVPMIPFPLWAEQAMNARLIASDLKIGVEMVRSPKGEMVGEEVAKAVKLLLISEEGKVIRLRMQQLKRASATSVELDGSSYEGLKNFLQEISLLSQRKPFVMGAR